MSKEQKTTKAKAEEVKETKKTTKTATKPKAEVKEKKEAKPKVDYKNTIKKLEEQVKMLNEKNEALEAENQKNLYEFQVLAKSFQTKAQEQINKKREELDQKLEEEKAYLKKYGSQKMLESIMEPILNIEQAVAAGKTQDAVKAYVIGFEMLLNQFYGELESFGVQSIEPKAGEEFNPELHYVMSQVEGGETNTIKETKKKGFKLHDRVLKPATVVTFK